MIVEKDNIPITQIEIKKNNLSRKTNPEKDLNELIQSIKSVGLLQPIGVYPLAYKKYALLYGQRRLLAFKKMKKKKIPAVIII